jgi:hypothetical protein
MTRKPWTKAWIVPIAMMTNTIASIITTVPLVIATSHSCMVGTSEYLQPSRSRPAGPAPDGRRKPLAPNGLAIHALVCPVSRFAPSSMLGAKRSVRTGPRMDVTSINTSTALSIGPSSIRCPAPLRVS